jgi:thymidylate kinase
LYHLFVANRFEKLDALRMALASHDFVIVDRYSYSGIAYTRANGHQVNIEDALAADVAAVLPPHMIFYLPPVAIPIVKEIYDELRVEVSIEYERIWSVAGTRLPLVRVPRAGIKATTDFIIEHLLGQKKE